MTTLGAGPGRPPGIEAGSAQAVVPVVVDLASFVRCHSGTAWVVTASTPIRENASTGQDAGRLRHDGGESHDESGRRIWHRVLDLT